MTDFLKEFWGPIVGSIGALGWLFRLEGRVNGNAASVLRLEKQIESDRVEARSARAESLDMMKEIRQDVKMLIMHKGNGT